MPPLELVQITAEDRARVAVRADLVIAISRLDFPGEPARSRADLLAALAHPFPGGDNEHWLAYAGSDAVGWGHLHLPMLDNVDNATIEVQVHPDHRRRGIGRQLAEHMINQARAAGRRRVITEICETGPVGLVDRGGGLALARSMGAERALAEKRRRVELTDAALATAERLLAAAEAASRDYHLVPWVSTVPDALLEGIVTLESRMTVDAPMGELAWEPEQHDAKRWRQMEATIQGRGSRTYGCASVHSATGEVTGYTLCGVAPDVPEQAWQWATIVLPAHRGHRLGLRLKADNLLRLHAQEPTIRAIDTWNAAENQHMIAVNEALGFTEVDTWAEWQLELT